MNDTIAASRTPRPLRAVAAAAACFLAGGGVLTAVAPAAEAAELPDTFVSTATTWAYSDDATDPAAGAADRLSWTLADYDDSAWKSATGAFGAKNGAATGLGSRFPITTLLNHYIDGRSAPAVPTYHFRTSFDVTADQLADIGSLRGEIVYDDAVQIFVNGEKVAGFVDDRVEEAPEADRNLVYAGASGGNPVTSTFTVSPEDLVAGENTLAVALHQDRATSSDIYLDVTSLAPVPSDLPAELSDIVMTVGSDETSRGITWYSNVDTAQVVQLAPASAVTDGSFPADAVTVPATGGPTTSGEFRRSATLTDLAESTDYAYRVGNDTDGWSATSTFSTGTTTGDYDFLFVGDPQIGASGDVARDQAGWTDTLAVAEAAFPDSELIFSAGDQVESAGNEAHYDAFLAPDQLRRLPLVPTNGNHDVGSKAYEQHFTLPNNDPTAGAATSASASGGNYWFTHKDVLYLNINSNNGDVASHEAFLRRVVAEQGGSARWVVLAFHHSIYSVAAHVNDARIKDLRAALPPIISDLGIDLVLQGHDHSYTRSFLLEDGDRADATEVPGQSEVVPGEGEVLYVTANSASGSKYYDVRAPDAPYASVINQEKVRNYSHVEVTDETITVSTMRSEQAGDGKAVNSVVDQVTLRKPAVEVPAEPDPEPVPGDPTPGDPTPGEPAPEQPAPGGSGDPEPTTPPAAPGAAPKPATPGSLTEDTRGTVSAPTTARAGQSITVTVGAAHAGRPVGVWLHPDEVLLGIRTVGADGTVRVTVPAGTDTGTHRLVVLDADGEVLGWQDVEITAAGSTAGGGLAVTGTNVLVGLLLAAGLVAGGTALLVLRRRATATD
ncbi:fibronectin type III domain-containing protein [Sanguibacter suaedae]|uniref:fibronectin type III domain-containing protein n=1 Tax=Sanguibacter suaedae TaxID=2795737 RepID=UPI0027DDBE7B|nr:fibronectin type III domain-containing protein [Sanguibacter suaedae]